MNNAYLEILENFLKDTAEHTIELLRDDGLYRHLKCTRGGSQTYRFDIITWPGYLCVCGDMGDYVFARTPDMFGFFRPRPGDFVTDPSKGSLPINPHYWSEKLQAPKRESVMEFSLDKFKEAVQHYVDAFKEENQPDEDASDERREQWQESLAELNDELDTLFSEVDEYSGDVAHTVAIQKAQEFEGLDMHDIYEYSMRDYTFHFIWCLYAIVWGIVEYDKQKSEAPND